MSLVRQLTGGFLVMNVTLLIFLGIAFTMLEPGTADYVITQLTAAILGINVVAAVIVLYTGWEPL